MSEPRCCCLPNTDAADCMDLRTYGYAPARDLETCERRAAEDCCECGCHAERDDDGWQEEDHD